MTQQQRNSTADLSWTKQCRTDDHNPLQGSFKVYLLILPNSLWCATVSKAFRKSKKIIFSCFLYPGLSPTWWCMERPVIKPYWRLLMMLFVAKCLMISSSDYCSANTSSNSFSVMSVCMVTRSWVGVSPGGSTLEESCQYVSLLSACSCHAWFASLTICSSYGQVTDALLDFKKSLDLACYQNRLGLLGSVHMFVGWHGFCCAVCGSLCTSARICWFF